MIFYATKETVERLKIKTYDKLSDYSKQIAQNVITNQSGDDLLEGGMKLFYFDRRKCLQVMNFASKFTIFIFDIKVNDMDSIPNIVANYLIELYKDDETLIELLEGLFEHYSLCTYSKLTNRSIISSLNHNQSEFALDGYIFYEYINNGVLNTIQINKDVNFDYFVTQKRSGKIVYFLPGDRFRELIIERYKIS
jgi:hypothetical protein